VEAYLKVVYFECIPKARNIKDNYEGIPKVRVWKPLKNIDLKAYLKQVREKPQLSW
jgi:hypothetical protein